MGFLSDGEKFFKEFKDSTNSVAFWSLISFAMGVLLLGVYTVVPEQRGVVSIYGFMLLTAGIFLAVESVSEKSKTFASISFGNLKGKFPGFLFSKTFLFPVLTGSVFTFALLSRGFSVAVLSTVGIPQEFYTILYVVVASPLVEELFFRGTVFPLINQNVGILLGSKVSWVIALVSTNLAFAGYHALAYGADINAMVIAFGMGVIWTVGNYYFKSIGFGVSSHLANNAVVVLG